MTRIASRRTRNQKRSGFTLVELAIVLVIIGLIVGGILVGQDLIKAATVRATLSDLEKYNSAATTFRTKYSGLPGDLLSSYAAQFGFLTATGRTGAAGLGDGNGLVEGCAAGAIVLGCETALFWTDLSTAGLIPQRLATYDSSVTVPAAAITTIAAMQGYLPVQKLRQGTFQYVYTNAGRNFFILSTLTAPAAGGALSAAAGVTPGEARSMDEKLDDALPLSGVVRSIAAGAGLVTLSTAGAAATDCVSSAAGNPYNATPAAIDNINCSVQFRGSF
jgi:prepilin-type N-terminal cleavage/methylation domain-containing protein